MILSSLEFGEDDRRGEMRDYPVMIKQVPTRENKKKRKKGG